jgi:hypothetical protein
LSLAESTPKTQDAILIIICWQYGKIEIKRTFWTPYMYDWLRVIASRADHMISALCHNDAGIVREVLWNRGDARVRK